MNLIERILHNMQAAGNTDYQSELLRYLYTRATVGQQGVLDVVFVALCGKQLSTLIRESGDLRHDKN